MSAALGDDPSQRRPGGAARARPRRRSVTRPERAPQAIPHPGARACVDVRPSGRRSACGRCPPMRADITARQFMRDRISSESGSARPARDCDQGRIHVGRSDRGERPRQRDEHPTSRARAGSGLPRAPSRATPPRSSRRGAELPAARRARLLGVEVGGDRSRLGDPRCARPSSQGCPRSRCGTRRPPCDRSPGPGAPGTWRRRSWFWICETSNEVVIPVSLLLAGGVQIALGELASLGRGAVLPGRGSRWRSGTHAR